MLSLGTTAPLNCSGIGGIIDMAEYNVTSFSEFYNAFVNASRDDVINCPENAVWDMNELDPTGSITSIWSYNGFYIHGNGTTLKNFHGRFENWSNRKFQFDNFHIENMLATSYPFMKSSFSQCKISVQCGVNVEYLGDDAIFSQCSLNIDAQASAFRLIDASIYGGDDSCQYCRIEITAPNVTGTFPTWYNEYHKPEPDRYCEMIYHTPNASALQVGYQTSCTIRGEMTGVTSILFPEGISDQSVICMDSMDNLDIETIAEEQRKWLVTDAQLRDIEYLHSIGFVIGSE